MFGHQLFYFFSDLEGTAYLPPIRIPHCPAFPSINGWMDFTSISEAMVSGKQRSTRAATTRADKVLAMSGRIER